MYFAEVFQRVNPGFDVVIGNPPYIDYRKIDQITKNGLNKFETYNIVKTGSIYIYFIENGMSILRNDGTLVYINPYQYLVADSGLGIRAHMVTHYNIEKIIDVSNIKVFSEASTYTCINFFNKSNNFNNDIEIVRCDTLDDLRNKGFLYPQTSISAEDGYRIYISNKIAFVNKISESNEKLGALCDMFCGTSSSGFGKKIISKKEYKNLLISEKHKYHQIVQTKNTIKYAFIKMDQYIVEDIYSGNAKESFLQEKIFFARMTKNIRCSYTKEPFYGGKVNVLLNFKINPKYLLAILNSSLISLWYNLKNESKHLSGGYLGFDLPSVKELPIRNVNSKQQTFLINLVDQILAITQNIDYSENPDKQTKVKNLESQIDHIVYKLYDLTSEEIKIVEEFNEGI